MVKNKKGDMTISMIVWIAIGVIVLVFMIFGFTTGWNNLWDKITIIGGADINTDIIRQACSMSCMTGAGYGFCNQERDLTFEKGKTITGSCNDFATLNPSLGIEKCSTACSNAADVCKIGGKEDKNCDGVAEDAEEKERGEGVENEKEKIIISTGELILLDDGEENGDPLSLEECKNGLEQRKIDLAIPKQLCYWEAMTRVYDEKCENLDKNDISEIFEKKNQYREANSPDWPSLNTEGDFCVPVIYDCDLWLQRKGSSGTSTGGFLTSDGKFIFINPFAADSKIEILLHEGLHSIQDLDYRGEIIFNEGFFEAYPEYIGIATETENLRNKLQQSYENLFDNVKLEYLEERSKLVSSMDVDSFDFNKLRALEAKYNEDTKFVEELYIDRILTNSLTFASVATRDLSIIDKESYYYSHFSEGSEFGDLIKNLRETLGEGEYFTYLLDMGNYHYLSKLIELDPRLSEVHRYWFDKTAPNCEVIYTSEEFERVLKIFLQDKELDTNYQKTQTQLNDVLEMARKLDSYEETWNELIGRGPGLASTQELNTEEMYA